MTPFLQQVAQLFYDNYTHELDKIVFVFPNRRAGIFFQRYLAQAANKPLLSPSITTINNLFGSLSDSRLEDRTSLLLRLYKIYSAKTNKVDSFDDFIFWGEMLLNDFDDIDKYLVDAQKLFSSVEEIREIEENFQHLDKEQIELITRFWSNFIPAHTSERKQNFLKTWQILYPLYQELKNSLEKEKLAYEGMLFRQIVDLVTNTPDLELPFEKVVFVGLNAMTLSEKVLLKNLRDRGIADFYWDYQSSFLTDPDNRASLFARENLTLFPSKHNLPKMTESQRPHIEVIAVPSSIGQTKCAHQLIEELVKKGAISTPDHAINTAVVLPDETLLMPMLYAVPQEIETINVTMGYALSNTPIAGLMKFIFELQLSCKWENNKAYFHHQAVTAILNHRYLRLFAPQEAHELINKIRTENWIYIDPNAIGVLHPIFSKIFKPVSTHTQTSSYIKEFLEDLQTELKDGQEDSYDVSLSELEKEFIFHFYLATNRLGDLLNFNRIECSLRTYFRILNQLTQTITIPFRGEPLSGLQVMGVLETRGLDFENQIILSMNDGIFPSKNVASSFIPHHIRKGFQMSTSEHQDAIYAYHFYRMISRAKNIYLLYDTRSTGMQTGEISRYIHQLKYHYQWPMLERAVTSDIQIAQEQPISISKSEAVVTKLKQYLNKGKKSLSASAIISYLNCPLQFYFQYVEHLREQEEVSETLESNTFGTIFHAVMETLYKPFEGKTVEAKDIENMIADNEKIEQYIQNAYEEHFHIQERGEKLKGYNAIVSEVLNKYIRQMLSVDSKHAPFLHIASEMFIQSTIALSSGERVNVKGIIDRVDKKDGNTQIIDYKTGRGLLSFSQLDQLFTATEGDWPKAVMQVFFYALLYTQKHGHASITPRIYFMRHFFKKDFDSVIEISKPTKEDPNEEVLPIGPITNFENFVSMYEKRLSQCLEEIFDTNTPFTQTDKQRVCQYCPMASLCKR